MADLIDRNSLNEAPDYDAGLLNDFGGGNVEWWQDYLRAEISRTNEFWRDAIAALPAQGVRVRPLEWIDFEGRGAKAQAWNEANYMIQKWSDGRWEISASYPGYSTFIEGTGRFYPTLDAAKAAAQADYERRILAALAPAEAGGVDDKTRILHERPVRVCPICDIADCAAHRDTPAPVDALVKAAERMEVLSRSQMRTADYHGEGCNCYRCAQDALFAALAAYRGEKP